MKKSKFLSVLLSLVLFANSGSVSHASSYLDASSEASTESSVEASSDNTIVTSGSSESDDSIIPTTDNSNDTNTGSGTGAGTGSSNDESDAANTGITDNNDASTELVPLMFPMSTALVRSQHLFPGLLWIPVSLQPLTALGLSE